MKSITIQNTQLPQSVNVVEGTLQWTKASTLEVPGIINVPIKNTTAANVGNPVMIKSGSGVLLDVVITVGSENVSYNNVEVKDTEGGASGQLIPEEGKSHLITLTLTEPEKVGDDEKVISTNATVTDWSTGHTGGADLK